VVLGIVAVAGRSPALKRTMKVTALQPSSRLAMSEIRGIEVTVLSNDTPYILVLIVGMSAAQETLGSLDTYLSICVSQEQDAVAFMPLHVFTV
jgi:hypothetical protein